MPADNKKLLYFNSDTEIRPGDRIRFGKLLSVVSGTVVYVPGFSSPKKLLGWNKWAIELDNEPGKIRTLPYLPSREPFADKNISFSERGVLDE